MLRKLALAHWRQQAVLIAAQCILVVIATCVAWFLWLVPMTIDAKIRQDAGQIDLLIAPPTSNLQALLSMVYHLDMPVGNLPADTLEQWAAHPMVSQAYSIALGDSIRGFRVMGIGSLDTNFQTAVQGIQSLYAPALVDSAPSLQLPNTPSAPMLPNKGQVFPAVLGAYVAHTLNFQSGQTFYPQHGLQTSGPTHHDISYQIVAVLPPTGTVLDRLVLIPIEAVWAAHEGTPSDAAELQQLKEAREISGVLLRYRSPLGIAVLPRAIREAGLTAASPALESQRLQTYIDTSTDILWIAAGIIGICILFSLVLSIRLGLQLRMRMAAILHILGARRRRIGAVIAFEYACIWAIGTVLASLALTVAYLFKPIDIPWAGNILLLCGTVFMIGFMLNFTVISTLIFSSNHVTE